MEDGAGGWHWNGDHPAIPSDPVPGHSGSTGAVLTAIGADGWELVVAQADRPRPEIHPDFGTVAAVSAWQYIFKRPGGPGTPTAGGRS